MSHVNRSKSVNFENPTNMDNPVNTDNENENDSDKSSDYSTELINSSKLSSSSHKSSSSSNISDSSSEILSETKFYWEYGNTGLKIKEFKKKMSRNLAIMYYIDRLFNEYIDTVLSNNYSKLFSSSSNVKFNLKT